MFPINRFFPFLAVAVSLLAWHDPEPLLDWKSAITPLLTAVMFCMGLTLRWQDFRRIWKKPEPVALGILLQFTLMPLIAWALAWAFNLPDELAIGMILVGACAGGTASNVMTYLAGGDVALSISMTLASTLWGLFLTPWLVWFYARSGITVDSLGMLASIGQMVILPIAAGLFLNQYLPQVRAKLHNHLADIASAIILLIIAIIVSLNADEIATVGTSVLAAVILHNFLGLAGGYAIARWNGHTEVQARTIAIEVGMQNSGLAVALALKFYTPAAALPGALFSVWHNVSGALLAAYFRWQTQKTIKRQVASHQAIKITMEKQE
ncbi:MULTISPECIES: bile acid:sodium symporter family protein [Thalassolituus]|jgi:BASS family bile acid:Na+ symporter|uniref:bile acid:sodium symporter family protein n=1 Tax=Thalassolituus TaxID=187492 RepID=UPI00042DD4A2|nr:bile acid:sodium symporter family protein [Thalassolituus oleivorans]AHK16385.1 sodium transporter [Thalassolituus oleivorans R6-15]MBQ0728583.1 bile acid:sodium symporter family protein [Thalassolituus oleivorans]MBQ0781078.1 bile acid:sodium symporter family protein [Thalassolituus oleivorans]